MIQVIDRSFGFDTAVEEAQRAISAAHVEAGSFENGIGLVKLMGRHSGKLRHGQIQSLTTMSHIKTLMYCFIIQDFYTSSGLSPIHWELWMQVSLQCMQLLLAGMWIAV